MNLIEIVPLPLSSSPFTTQSVTMDGRSYVMTLRWNSRTDRWTLGIATEEGDEVLNGALVQIGVDILRTVPTTLDYVPPGKLYVAGQNDPDLSGIESVTMFYVPGES